MVHFARSGRPEIVLFGSGLQLQSPPFLYAGKHILLKNSGPDQLRVLRYTAGKDDRQETCSTRLEDVIQTIVRLEGGYGDVLQAMQEAKRREYLTSRVVIDALPRPARRYRREATNAAGEEAAPERLASTPLPGLFASVPADGQRGDDESAEPQGEVSEDKAAPQGVFTKVGSWIYSEKAE